MPTKRYGLIGSPLSHSFSAIYFAEKFHKLSIDAEYFNFELESLQGIRQRMIRAGVSGFNVTIPYKMEILENLDKISPEAAEIRAVNTVSVKNGFFTGYNTDYEGFMESLQPMLLKDDRSALILGTGGASRAVAFALKKLEIPYNFVSRTGEMGYNDLNERIIEESQIIVNTTPPGTWPKVNECPEIPFEFLNSNHLVYDLIYNPEKSLFLKKAEERGARIKNGMEMLERQAELSWTLWNQNE